MTPPPRIVSGTILPENPDLNSIYCLSPNNPDESFYWERVDRNIGWITKEEQQVVRSSIVGVAGCGGMGGMIAERLLRLGIGEIRIADPEVFDASNINRQFAARRDTVGRSKAFETARMLRNILDDTTLVVYPQGISEEAIDDFLKGCNAVCDEIEFWAVGSRILLHRRARAHGIPVFNCNTVGFGTRLFLFTPDGQTMEACLGLDYEEARMLQEKMRTKKAMPEEVERVMRAVIRGLVPDLPEYCDNGFNRASVYSRLFNEGKAPIIATNPPLATGFVSDHVLMHLLKDSPVARHIVRPPKMPGYLLFDAMRLSTAIVQAAWW